MKHSPNVIKLEKKFIPLNNSNEKLTYIQLIHN